MSVLQNSKLNRCFGFTDYLFLILSVFTCTYFVYRDLGIRMFFGYALLGIIVLIHVLRRILFHKTLRIDTIRGAFLVLVFVVLLSFLRPDSRHDADTLSYVIAMMICGCYLALSSPGEKECTWVLAVMNCAALCFAIYVVFFAIFEDLFWGSVYTILSDTAAEYLDYYVPKGYSVTIGGCTYTNYILFIGMACNLGLLLKNKGWNKRRLFSIFAIALYFVALVLVGRRGEVLGVLVTFVIMFIILGNRRQRWIRFGVLAGVGIVALGVLILCLPVLRSVDVLYRYVLTLENLLSGQDITSGRIQLYQWAVALFLDSPVFGIGWAGFSNHITPEFRAIHGEGVSDVHCIYLQFLCETGIVGTLFIVIPMFYIYIRTFRQMVRVYQMKHTDRKTDTVICFCGVSFAIQTFLLVMGIYDPCFERLIFWCFYSIAVIFGAAALEIEGHQRYFPTMQNLLKKVYKKDAN